MNSNMKPDSLPQLITDYLNQHERNMAWLANKAGLSLSLVYCIVNGEREPTLYSLERLGTVIGFEVKLVPKEGN